MNINTKPSEKELSPREAKKLLKSIVMKGQIKGMEQYERNLSKKNLKKVMSLLQSSKVNSLSHEVSKGEKEVVSALKKYKQRWEKNNSKSLYPKRTKYHTTKDAIKRRALAQKLDFSSGDLKVMEEAISQEKSNNNSREIMNLNDKNRAIEALAKIATHMRNKAKNQEKEFMIIKSSKGDKFASALHIKPAIMDPNVINSPIKKIMAPTPQFLEEETGKITQSIDYTRGKVLRKNKGKKIAVFKNKKPKVRKRNRDKNFKKKSLKIDDIQEYLLLPEDISKVKFEHLKEKSNLVNSNMKLQDKDPNQNYYEYLANNMQNLNLSTKSSRFLLGKSKFLKMVNKNLIDNTVKVQKEISDNLLVVKKSKDFHSINKGKKSDKNTNRSNKSLELRSRKQKISERDSHKLILKNSSVPPKRPIKEINSDTRKSKLSSIKENIGKTNNPKRDRILAAKSASEAIRKKIKMNKIGNEKEVNTQRKKFKTKQTQQNNPSSDIIRNFNNFNRIFNLFNLVDITGEEEDLILRMKYYVGRGNNQNLVSRHIQTRKHVAFSPFFNQSQFVWTQTSKQKNKISRYSNFKKKPISNFSSDDLKNFLTNQRVFKISKELVENAVDNFSKYKEIHSIEVRKLNLFNHIKGMKHIGRKQMMTIHIYQYCLENNLKRDLIIPKTFLINTKTCDEDIKNCLEEIKNEDPEGFQIPWIIKPGEFSNRGKGIEMAYTEEEVEPKVKKLLENRKGNVVLVQKYLIDPVLYKNRKFDLRCFAFVIKLPNKFSVFWYNSGYARTSSYEYSLENKTNLMVHLTNEAVQVKNKKSFGKFEDGNKLYYNELEEYFKSDETFVEHNKTFKDHILPQIKKKCVLSFEATSNKIIAGSDHVGVELLGYDFMIDKNLNVWLIEVNQNPCLSTLSPKQKILIDSLVNDCMRLGMDPLMGFGDDIQFENLENYLTDFELVYQKFY